MWAIMSKWLAQSFRALFGLTVQFQFLVYFLKTLATYPIKIDILLMVKWNINKQGEREQLGKHAKSSWKQHTSSFNMNE